MQPEHLKLLQALDEATFRRVVLSAYQHLKLLKNTEGGIFPPVDRKALAFTEEVLFEPHNGIY